MSIGRDIFLRSGQWETYRPAEPAVTVRLPSLEETLREVLSRCFGPALDAATLTWDKHHVFAYVQDITERAVDASMDSEKELSERLRRPIHIQLVAHQGRPIACDHEGVTRIL